MQTKSIEEIQIITLWEFYYKGGSQGDHAEKLERSCWVDMARAENKRREKLEKEAGVMVQRPRVTGKRQTVRKCWKSTYNIQSTRVTELWFGMIYLVVWVSKKWLNIKKVRKMRHDQDVKMVKQWDYEDGKTMERAESLRISYNS